MTSRRIRGRCVVFRRVGLAWLGLMAGGLTCLGLAVAGSPASPGQPAELFGLSAPGKRFVYVIDRSASMGEPEGRPLASAKAELLASLEALGESRQFHVIVYNERIAVIGAEGNRGRPQFADATMLQAVRRSIERVTAEGGTDHARAIEAATRLAPDAIFLLTDADGGDDLTENDMARLTRSLGGSTLLVAQFGGGDGRRSPRLARLAINSGGDYRVVDEREASASP